METASNPDDVENRARVDHRRPPVHGLEEPMWIAEDPETTCVGVGRVEAEAVGNLVAVVREYESSGESEGPLMKVPGRTVSRPSVRAGDSRSIVDRLRSLLSS